MTTVIQRGNASPEARSMALAPVARSLLALGVHAATLLDRHSSRDVPDPMIVTWVARSNAAFLLSIEAAPEGCCE